MDDDDDDGCPGGNDPRREKDRSTSPGHAVIFGDFRGCCHQPLD